jgi:hypothetical protein
VASRQPLLCLPGTYCSPEVFEGLDEAAFPDVQILPISWMTSPGPWDLEALGRRVAVLLRELDLGHDDNEHEKRCESSSNCQHGLGHKLFLL